MICKTCERPMKEINRFTYECKKCGDRKPTYRIHGIMGNLIEDVEDIVSGKRETNTAPSKRDNPTGPTEGSESESRPEVLSATKQSAGDKVSGASRRPNGKKL